MKVLIVGSGGREHAFAWRLRVEDPSLELVAAPGNAGLAECARCVPVTATDLDNLVALADVSTTLLVSRLLAPRLRMALLSTPALHLATLTSLAAALGTLTVGGVEAISASQPAGTVTTFPAAAFTLA